MNFQIWLKNERKKEQKNKLLTRQINKISNNRNKSIKGHTLQWGRYYMVTAI